MYAKDCMFLTKKGLQNSGLCSAHMAFEQEGLYRACAAVTRDLGLCGLTRDTAPLSRPVRQAQGTGDLFWPGSPGWLWIWSQPNCICNKKINGSHNPISRGSSSSRRSREVWGVSSWKCMKFTGQRLKYPKVVMTVMPVKHTLFMKFSLVVELKDGKVSPLPTKKNLKMILSYV